MVRGFDGISSYLFELRTDVFQQPIVRVFMIGVKIFLKVLVAQFVSIFILAILFGVDLNGVICQVNEIIGGVFQMILVTAGSDIPLTVPVTLDGAILHRGNNTNFTRSI